MTNAAAIKSGPKRATSSRPLRVDMLPAKRDYRRIEAFATEYLKVPKGIGARAPFKFRPWQRALVKSVYPPTGRRPRQGLWSLSRGQGKSALAAALGVYGLLADEIEGAQVIIVASDERQARIVYNAARRMIELDGRLREQVQFYADRIYVPSTDSAMFCLPSEPGALQGWDPSLMIIDELHVVTEPVWEAVTLAAGKRAESLTLAISTPADRTDSVMWRLVDYGRNHPEDRSFTLTEYAAPIGCAIDDEDAWPAAMPALDDFLERDAVRATLRTTTEAAFRRYRLGQWTGSANAWLEWGAWDKVADPTGGLPDPGTRVVLAFDGSASGDSTALIGATVTGRPYVFTVGLWESAGEDTGWRVPRGEVAGVLADAIKTWDVAEVAADPWGWRSELETWDTEYPGVIVEWNTGHPSRMAPATDRLAVAIREQTMSHDGDDRLAAHMSHAVAKATGYGDVITKDKRMSTRKIDGAVGAIIAHDRAVWHYQHPPKRRRVVAHR